MRTTQQLRDAWADPCKIRSARFNFWTGVPVTVDARILAALAALDSVLRKHDYKPRSGVTGAYNCRKITGGTGYSLHAYGIAVDINWNCLTGDTLVWTHDGLVRLDELSGTSARLLTRDPVRGRASRWVEAPIRSFGEQQTFDVVLTRRGIVKTVGATADHRWFVRHNVHQQRDKQRVHEAPTSDLRAGARIVGCLPPPCHTIVSSVGVAAGLVFGDGSLDRNRGSYANLYGVDLAELLQYFPLARVQDRTTPNAVPGVAIFGLPGSWKRLPDINESASYLLGWLAGYFAADGTVSEHGAALLKSVSRDNLEVFRVIATRVGIACNEIRERKPGSFKDDTTCFTMSLVASTVPDAFFVRSIHRDRFICGSRKTGDHFDWTVQSVEPRGVEPVYCPVVPGTGAFALDGWLLTGNSNPYGAELKTDMPRAMVDEITAIRTHGGLPVWRWGGSYHGNKDAMHFEIVASPAELAAGIQGQPTPVVVHAPANPDPTRPPIEEVEVQKLVQIDGDPFGHVYLVLGGHLEHIPSGEVAAAQGLDLSKIEKVPADSVLARLPRTIYHD